MESPEFLEPPESLEVEEGKDAIFTCLTKGKPVPSITWSQAGTPLVKDKHVFIKDKPDKNKLTNQSELKIKSVISDEHEGEYEVEVRNTAGSAQHNVQLIGRWPILKVRENSIATQAKF